MRPTPTLTPMRNALLFLLLLLPAAAAAQLYHPGEALTYKVSYRAKLFPNTEVATVTVRTDQVTEEGETRYRISGHGRTLPFYNLFFSLDDRYTLLVDPATQRTEVFESDIHEGSYTFRSRYDYDWQQMQVATRWRKRQNPEQYKTMPLSDESMDAISLFFNMRTAAAADFSPGERRQLRMVLEDTIRSLTYRFIGRETVKVRRLGTFRTLKFACTIGTSEGFSFTDGDEFFLWISDDDNKLPLRLESPIRVGSVRASLAEVSGTKYPLDSRVK